MARQLSQSPAAVAARDRPIIFSAPMVRALLDGRKTQTRRVLKPQPENSTRFAGVEKDGSWLFTKGCVYGKLKPRFVAGDRLWVREAHYLTDDGDEEYAVFVYEPDDVAEHLDNVEAMKCQSALKDIWPRHAKLRPSIHLPRWASRLTLIVEGVKVERVQSITRADAIAEGVVTEEWEQWRECAAAIGLPDGSSIENERDLYARLWNEINGHRAPWENNPWIVALTFRVITANIDSDELRAS